MFTLVTKQVQEPSKDCIPIEVKTLLHDFFDLTPMNFRKSCHHCEVYSML